MAQQREHVGMNRTGIQMSPFDTRAMLDEDRPTAGTPGDETEMTRMREAYIAESEGIGSIPVPGTMKGMVTMGVDMLKGDSPQVLLDKLAERLAFERTGTRLYDALLTKLDAMPAGQRSITHEQVAAIRGDEARHMLLAKEAIERMGGDPTAQTPSADVVGVESMGMVQVLTDPRTSLAQSLHAILSIELCDHAGWETLIALADEHGQDEMVSAFSAALAQETLHLQKVQFWYQEAVGLARPTAAMPAVATAAGVVPPNGSLGMPPDASTAATTTPDVTAPGVPGTVAPGSTRGDAT